MPKTKDELLTANTAGVCAETIDDAVGYVKFSFCRMYRPSISLYADQSSSTAKGPVWNNN